MISDELDAVVFDDDDMSLFNDVPKDVLETEAAIALATKIKRIGNSLIRIMSSFGGFDYDRPFSNVLKRRVMSVV